MITNPTELWHEFRLLFFNELQAMTPEQRSGLWASSEARTKGYLGRERGVLKRVAARMGCDYKQEYRETDAAFLLKNDGVKCRNPMVLIESENDHRRSDHEVINLLQTFVPLRVLIVCAQWSERRFPNAYWRNEGRELWRQAIAAFVGQTKPYGMPLGGVLGFLVGECSPDHVLRYYHFHCDLSRCEEDPFFSEEREEEIGPTPTPYG